MATLRNIPECDVTLVRHVYDMVLIALPASQHDRIWEDYICWVTGILPGKAELRIKQGEMRLFIIMI